METEIPPTHIAIAVAALYGSLCSAVLAVVFFSGRDYYRLGLATIFFSIAIMGCFRFGEMVGAMGGATIARPFEPSVIILPFWIVLDLGFTLTVGSLLLKRRIR